MDAVLVEETCRALARAGGTSPPSGCRVNRFRNPRSRAERRGPGRPSTPHLNRARQAAKRRHHARRHGARGARIGGRRPVAADQLQFDRVRLHGDVVDGAGDAGIGPDLDSCAREAEPGEAQRDGDVEVPGEGGGGLAGTPLEDLDRGLERGPEVEAPRIPGTIPGTVTDFLMPSRYSLNVTPWHGWHEWWFRASRFR